MEAGKLREKKVSVYRRSIVVYGMAGRADSLVCEANDSRRVFYCEVDCRQFVTRSPNLAVERIHEDGTVSDAGGVLVIFSLYLYFIISSAPCKWFGGGYRRTVCQQGRGEPPLQSSNFRCTYVGWVNSDSPASPDKGT
jgi:hypothetical protein